ncbi:MAG: MarR family transcriptional regulator [Lachnospiraceae bacterium]|nr:MarR family transcriptional regulator [Lachnospiraceae bacterium]
MGKRLHAALIETSAAHEKSSWAEFRKLNLSPGQPKVLTSLLYKEGYLQKELAEFCHVEPATMAVLLANMEKKGLIRKEITHVSGGKRAYRVYLTQLGRHLAEKVNAVVCEVEERGYRDFTEEEKEQLTVLLERVTKNLM